MRCIIDPVAISDSLDRFICGTAFISLTFVVFDLVTGSLHRLIFFLLTIY